MQGDWADHMLGGFLAARARKNCVGQPCGACYAATSAQRDIGI